MKLNIGDKTEIAKAVAEFMGNRRVCWATPGTDRHTSNFYGDTHVCRFTRTELASTIEMYHENYGDSDTLAESISEIITDMQFNRP